MTQWVVGALAGLLRAFLSLMPQWAVNTLDLSAFAEVAGTTGRIFNQYVPLTLLVSCILILIAARLALSVWHLVLFVYHQFWGSS